MLLDMLIIVDIICIIILTSALEDFYVNLLKHFDKVYSMCYTVHAYVISYYNTRKLMCLNIFN